MGEPRLSLILIGVVLIGLLATGLIGFLSQGASIYNAPGYTNSTLEAFKSSSDEVVAIANNTKGELELVGAQDNDLDVFGGMLSNAWTALKTTDNSMDSLFSMTTDAVGALPFINGAFSAQLTVALVTVIIIIFVIAIFFHFFKGSSRL